jgi:hypothetical protein
MAEGFQSNRDVATVSSAAERKRRVGGKLQFVTDTRDDSSGEVRVCVTDHFEGERTRELMASFQQFCGGQLEHGSGVLQDDC